MCAVASELDQIDDILGATDDLIDWLVANDHNLQVRKSSRHSVKFPTFSGRSIDGQTAPVATGA